MPSGRVVWFTGLSGAGKTTLAQATYRELEARGIKKEKKTFKIPKQKGK
jgi:adenylylsulfate kinase